MIVTVTRGPKIPIFGRRHIRIDPKVAISVEEMKSKYVKFPSISVCLDLDTDGEGEVGFREMRPLNETFSFLHFVRHLDNG